VRVAGTGERGRTRCLGESVRRQDVEAQPVQVRANLRIEAGASGDEQAHASTKYSMNARKEQRTRIEPYPPERPVGREEHSEHQAHGQARPGHFAGDALVDQIEKLRHACERGHAAFRQRTQQLGRIDRFEEDDARANRERKQQIGHLRERVKEREHAEYAVTLVDSHHGKGALAFGHQVAVRENDAFRIAGGSRGVEDHRRIGRSARALGARSERRVRHDRLHDGDRVVRRVEESNRCIGARLLTAVRHGVEVTRGREDDAWLAVGDQPCDLSGLVGGVERYGNRADAEDAEVRGAPVGIVFRQDGAPIPTLNALALKPYGNAPSHTVELAVCDCLDTVPALDFDSRTPFSRMLRKIV